MIIAAYRKMTGLTQKEMSKKLGISESAYRSKELGKSSFKDIEIIRFVTLVREVKSDTTVEEIFFEIEKTKKDGGRRSDKNVTNTN